MASSVGSVSIDLDAKIAKFESDIGRAARLLEKEISRAASVAERAMQRASREISKEVDQIAKKAEAFGKQVLSLFAISAVFDYAKRLAGVADEFSNIQAKIKLAAGEQVNLAKATETVFNVAQKTFQSFDATTALVQRTATALKSAGRDASDSFNTAIRLAEVFNKTLVVSSATTQQAQAAVQQFAQAIGSGRLQGDEFRSITENNTRFQQLLADALGVTTGKLKEMSSEGKLTVSTLLKVLNDTKKLDEEFAKMPLTIGRATTILSNAWTKFIGEGDQARGTSRAVAEAIKSVANNLDSVVNAVVLLGSVVATVYGAKILKAGAMWIASLLEQIVMTRAATAAAAEMGMTLAATAGPASNLAKLFAGIGSAIGVAAAALVGWEIGTYLRNEFTIVKQGGEVLSSFFVVVWEGIKAGGTIAWLSIKIAVFDYINAAKEAAASTLDFAAKIGSLNPLMPQGVIDQYKEWSAAIKSSIDPTDGLRVQVALAKDEIIKKVNAIKADTNGMIDYYGKTGDAAKGNEGLAASTGKVTQELDKMTVNGGETLRGLNAQEKAADQYAKAMDRLGEYANAYTKDMGAASRVTAEHNKRLDDIDEQMNKAIAASKGLKNAKDLESAARDKTRAALDSESAAYAKNLKELEKQKNIAGPILNGLQDRMSDAFLSDRDLAGVQAVRQLTDAYNSLDDELKADVMPRMGQMTEAVREQALATYDAEKSAQFWRATWESAVDSVADVFGQFATGQIRSAKDLGKALQDVFKQTFQKIVAEMVRSGIMKIFSSFFGGGSGGGGGGGGFWGTLIAGAASYAGSGSSGSGSYSGSAGSSAGNSQPTSGYSYAGSSGGINIFSAASWVQAGRNLYSGFSSVAYGSGQTTWLGSQMGVAAYGPGMATTYTPTGAGLYGGYAAGAAGAYYGYTQRGNGGLSSVAAGASYGALGLGVAGAVGGVASGAGAVAGVTGAFASLGSAAWIPVVGWILAILAVVDIAAGGRLFGTRRRTEWAEQSFTIDANGSSSQLALTKVRQRSLWGGRDWTTYYGAGTPEMDQAAAEFRATIMKSVERVASETGEAVRPLITATLTTATKYDKRGNSLGTNYVANINGVEYKEDSADLAAARVQAEAIINQLGQEASRLAEAYRANVDDLVNVAAVMVQAKVDLKNGDGLLGAGDTLTSVMDWLERQRGSDEQLTDTYARLAQASAQYRQMLDQVADAIEQINRSDSPVDRVRNALADFDKQLADSTEALNAAAQAAGLTGAAEIDLAKLRELQAAQIDKLSGDFWGEIDGQISALTQVSTPAGDFASAMQSISGSMRDNEQIANLLARAQGRSGASASELYKIYELGARQMAAAIAKLQEVGKQQARSLGYLGLESVADYDARIEELESRAAAAAEAVGGFGNAMESVAQSATDSINLLLGNLSPLNDQQKLQVALGGLSAGTASPEQVLEIGRRLYSSTQQYTDLFNQVMNMRPRTSVGGGGGGGGGDGQTVAPLSAAEEAELLRLRIERDEKVRQQRFAEATEFANTVASLAAAQGISFQEVAANIGFNLEDLGKDLGLSMDDLLKYLEGIDVQQTIIPDSITSNFDRLLEALDRYLGNGTGYSSGAVDDEGSGDGITIDGRRQTPTGRQRPNTPSADPLPGGSEDRLPSTILNGMADYTRIVSETGNRNTQQIVNSTDRNTAAVEDLGRELREGFGNQPRGTRWERETVRV